MARGLLFVIFLGALVGCRSSSSLIPPLPHAVSAAQRGTTATNPGQQVLLGQMQQMAEQDAMSRRSGRTLAASLEN